MDGEERSGIVIVDDDDDGHFLWCGDFRLQFLFDFRHAVGSFVFSLMVELASFVAAVVMNEALWINLLFLLLPLICWGISLV